MTTQFCKKIVAQVVGGQPATFPVSSALGTSQAGVEKQVKRIVTLGAGAVQCMKTTGYSNGFVTYEIVPASYHPTPYSGPLKQEVFIR